MLRRPILCLLFLGLSSATVIGKPVVGNGYRGVDYGYTQGSQIGNQGYQGYPGYPGYNQNSQTYGYGSGGVGGLGRLIGFGLGLAGIGNNRPYYNNYNNRYNSNPYNGYYNRPNYNSYQYGGYNNNNGYRYNY